ncbi:MAG: N-6 DNA methylase, partial [Salibacteraceae bacterium]
MADRTSDRYQGLGEGFDFLKSGMGISQSIHGVLTLLFIKYVSDKFGSSSDSAVHIPHGASFEDLLRLKDRKDFGERLNSHGVLPIFRANGMGEALSDVDFKVDHLERDDFWSAFVGIFQRPVFDFSDPSNQDDTLLSDALAFLMRHAYTEAGTNEVPLQTPPEVARALAQIVGWHPTESSEVSLYDPACSDGTLLYEVA